jgi:hypothetical protein
MGTFTNAIIREIGRNYGKAISNSLLGNKHSNPVRIVSSPRVLCAGTGGRNYPNKLEKLLATYEIKGHTATFNVAQNMTNYYMDLVEDAQADGTISLLETKYLLEMFKKTHKEMSRLVTALEDLDKPDWAEKVDKKDDDLWAFILELQSNFVVPEKPGFGIGKKHKLKVLNHKMAINLKVILDAYKQAWDNQS